MGLLCSSATFAVWTSAGGLETRQFTFFIIAAVVCLSVYGNSRRGLLAASLSLAAAALTRPEGLMLAACCFSWFAVQRMVTDGRDRSRLARDMMFLVAPFVVLVSAHFLFRYAYYGEWLPNTYYAKHVRPWYESGFRYLWAAALETGLYLLLPLTFLALRTRWRMYQDGTYALALLCVAVHMAYLLPIGGDHFEYRPLDFYWPLLAVPAAEGIAHLGSRVSAGLRRLPRVPGRAVTGEDLHDSALPARTVLRQLDSGRLAIQGDRDTQEQVIARGCMSSSMRRRKSGCWPRPGCRCSSPSPTTCAGSLSTISSPGPSPIHRRFANLTTQAWKPYEKMERGIIPDDALTIARGLGRYLLSAGPESSSTAMGSDRRDSGAYAGHAPQPRSRHSA